MVNAYDTHADGQKWSAAFQNAVNAAIGAVNNVGFRPYSAYDYKFYKEGTTYYRRDGRDGAIDDSGTNFGNLFQSAINALEGETDKGGTIAFGKGDFQHASKITGYERLTLIGAGREATFLTMAGNDVGMEVDYGANWAEHGLCLMNLSVRGNTGNSNNVGLKLEKVSKACLINTTIYNSGSHGLLLRGTVGLTFLYPRIYGCTGSAIKVEEADDGTKGTTTTLLGGALRTSAKGLWMYDAGTLMAYGTIIESNTKGTVFEGGGVGKVKLDGCWFENNTTYDVETAKIGANQVGNLWLRDCIFDGTVYLNGDLNTIIEGGSAATATLTMTANCTYPHLLWHTFGTVNDSSGYPIYINRNGQILEIKNPTSTGGIDFKDSIVKDLKNYATSVAGNQNKVIEVKIGATSYYIPLYDAKT